MTETEAYIKKEEGYRPHIYRCTAGARTIGIGYNLDAGMPEDEAEALLHIRVEKLRRQIRAALPWFDDLNEARQAALLSMGYQMGFDGLMKWRRTLGLIQAGKYDEAAQEMTKSRWYGQTPPRARRTCYMVSFGKFPVW